MSPPPTELLILEVVALWLVPFGLGCLCSRLERRGLRVLLITVPPLLLIVVWPGLFLFDPGVLVFFSQYVVFTLAGYIVGCVVR